MNKTQYSEEFRIESADYALSTGRPVSQVACEMGINQKTLNNWVVKRRKELADPKAFAQQQADEMELRAAKKRIRELEMENEFLKKPQPSLQKSNTN